MSRFRNLEFDEGRQRRHSVGDSSDQVRDAGYYLSLADKERRQRHHETALRYYSRCLEDDATVTDAWVGQIRMLIGLEEYREAELWSHKALERFRDHSELLAGRAQACCRLGKRDEGMRWSDAALQAKGDSAYRWQARGELMLAGRCAKDEYCFSKASLVDPDWLVAMEIGEIYLYYDVPTKAQRWLVQVTERAPDSACGWLLLGRAQTRAGSRARARKSLEECLKLAPFDTEARQSLAELDRGGWLRRLFGGRGS